MALKRGGMATKHPSSICLLPLLALALVAVLTTSCLSTVLPIADPTRTSLAVIPETDYATPTPAPTSTPRVVVSEVERRLQRARELLGELRKPARFSGDVAAATREIEGAIALFLTGELDSGQDIDGQRGKLDELRRLLTFGRGTATMTVVDVDGDEWSDLLVSTNVYDAPVLAFVRAGETYKVFRMVPNPSSSAKDGEDLGIGKVEKIGDLDADTRLEIVVSYSHFSGTGEIKEVSIFQWDGQGFRTLYNASVS
ncbi:MAG: hypothetical protein M1343_06140 [Chloroflexi bacterium]|nr:hypothetical protein [Chloroflexota bacterium]